MLKENHPNYKRIKEVYASYWEFVKHSVDELGWVYEKEVVNALDSYYESNTGNEVEFQKSFGRSGDNPYWKTKGARWRPLLLSDLTDEPKKIYIVDERKHNAVAKITSIRKIK